MKFLLIAVFMLYPKNADPYVEKVEIWGSYETQEACKKETHLDFGAIPPGLSYLDCVQLKGK